tara:strand:+ start:945 stop:1364 length:420 start_codon:yes stop_codon:yes gene_type:complete
MKNLKTAKSNTTWTPDEEKTLIDLNSQARSVDYIAETLGRSRKAIQNRLSIMALRGDLFLKPIDKPAKRKRRSPAPKLQDPIMRAKIDEIMTQPDSMWPVPLPLQQHDDSISVKVPRKALYGAVSAALMAAAFYAGMNV